MSFFITLDNLVSRLGHTETIGSLCSEMDHRCSQNVVRKNKRAHEAQPVVSMMFLPHFDVFCDLMCTDPQQRRIDFLIVEMTKGC